MPLLPFLSVSLFPFLCSAITDQSICLSERTVQSPPFCPLLDYWSQRRTGYALLLPVSTTWGSFRLRAERKEEKKHGHKEKISADVVPLKTSVKDGTLLPEPHSRPASSSFFFSFRCLPSALLFALTDGQLLPGNHCLQTHLQSPHISDQSA